MKNDIEQLVILTVIWAEANIHILFKAVKENVDHVHTCMGTYV